MLFLFVFVFVFGLFFLDEAFCPPVVDDDLFLLEHFEELGFVEHALVVEQLEEDVLGVRELFVGRCGRALHVSKDL